MAKTFYEQNVQKNTEEIIKICDQTKNQDNSAWRMHRSIRITGSSCYELFTYFKNKNPDWNKKIESYLNPKPLHTKAIKYGKDLEHTAFKVYKAKRNPLMKKCGFVLCSTDPWMGVSPDGVDPLNKILLEIKCPVRGAEHGVDWLINECKATRAYVKKVDSTLELNRNHKYFAQVQLAMHVLHISECDFIVFSKHDNDFVIIEVGYDDTFARHLIETLRTIFFTYMLPQIAAKAT